MKDLSSSSFHYYTIEALHSLRLSKGRTFVAVMTIGFSLFIFGIYLLLASNFTRIIEKWQEEIHIEVFLSDDLTLNDTERLGNQLRKRTEIESATYISKSEAWEKFKSQGYEQFFAGLSQNPLPASFQLKLKADKRDIPSIRILSQELLKIPGVEDVTSGIDLVEKLEIMAHVVRIAGMFIGMLILIASVFIISNTIKLSLYTRIDEIEIMKLVGATNKFIMLPYVLEGIIQGFVGATLAISLLFAGYSLFLSQLRSDEVMVLGIGVLSFITPLQWIQLTGLGVLIGFLGSYLSVSQFLRPQTTRRI